MSKQEAAAKAKITKQRKAQDKIVEAHRAEIDAMRASGKKPSEISAWLKQFGFTGTGATLNGILPWSPRDADHPANSKERGLPGGQDVGYIRVSADDQNEARQVEGLRQAIGREPDRVFIDRASGKDRERPAFQEMLAYVRQGDRLVVHSIDRLARSLADLEKTVEQLTAKGVEVAFIKEGLRFTGQGDEAFAIFQRQLLGAFAQFERSIIRERQREGIELAKRRGVYKGRAPALLPPDKATLVARAKTERHTDLMREFEISKATFYRYIAP